MLVRHLGRRQEVINDNYKVGSLIGYCTVSPTYHYRNTRVPYLHYRVSQQACTVSHRISNKHTDYRLPVPVTGISNVAIVPHLQHVPITTGPTDRNYLVLNVAGCISRWTSAAASTGALSIYRKALFD